jgi:replicative DNA helicase
MERTLPSNLEAERSVIGAILMHNDALDVAATAITAADFYRDAHRRIFEALVRLRDRKVALDLVTLKDELGRTGELDEVGGPAYIAAMTDGVPRSMNVEHYAGIIKEKAQLRGVIFTANKMLSSAYDAGEDASTIVAHADRAIIDLQLGASAAGLSDLRHAGARILNDLEYRLAHRGQLSGIDTGFDSINQITMGWQRGDMVVIAARPSIGKTTFALNTAAMAARTGRVAFFSLEMKRKQIENRLLSSLSRVPLTRIITGYLSDSDYTHLSQALDVMTTQMQLFIDDRAGLNIWDIRTQCRRMRAEGGIDLIVIDYVGLIASSLDKRGATRNDEVSDISRRVKGLANEVDAPILLLSQLNRANEKRNDPRPKLSDLRESGALEQDADIVGFLHRKNHREGGTTAFILEKQRNGPTGSMNLTLDRDRVLFEDGGDDPPPEVEDKKVEQVPPPADRRLYDDKD